MATLDLGYKSVELYTPGSLFKADIPGRTEKLWTVLTLQVIWEEGEQPAQLLTILAVDDEGEDLGEDTVTVNPDRLDITDL